jgi:two-component sensor histidine kinase
LWDELSAKLDIRHVDLFKTLSNSSETMLRMIDDLLLVSRLHSGVLRPKPRFLGAATIRSALIALEPLARQKQIGLNFELPEDFRIYADPELLGDVLQNLATNAIKFTNSGGNVTVSSAAGEGVGIVIRDTGVGIEPERLPGLLAPERCSSTPGTAGEKGTGLGLRICHDILAAHNGRMTIESRLGAGTTVVVRLPVVHPQVVTFGLSNGDQTLVERTVAKFGADVRSVSNSRDVIEAIRGHPPHLIVAGSGSAGEQLRTIAALKADADLATIPLALLTSVPVKETGPHAPEDVMLLPVDEKDLRAHLRRFLG